MTRADYPIGKKVQYVESGQPAEVVSIRDSDDKDYEDAETVYVKMNGQVLKSNVNKIEPRTKSEV